MHTGVAVTSLRARPDGALILETDDGAVLARAVVVATGAFQRAHRPAWVDDLPAGLPVLGSIAYRNPDTLPPGAVLVVGSGQTGCQIAEELVIAGRRVVLASGRAPWVPRRVEGRDIVDWILATPFFDQTVADLPGPAALLIANLQTTGARGGHDLHTRTLAPLGVKLAGHLAGFRPRYRDWIAHPDAFDPLGFPLQVDGASTVVPGLSFVGVHFLRKRKSSLLMGVGEDATVVARGVAERLSA